MEIDETTLSKDLVRKVNELFHLQETALWESKAIEMTRQMLDLKYQQGKLDVLRGLLGIGHGLDDFYVEKRIEKVEKRIDTIYDFIEAN